jgi:predicted DNA-binding protein with PD1-like motif
MKLETYLKTYKIPVAAFAKSIGVVRHAVYSYFDERDSKKIPSPDTMQKIFITTNGEVEPNDFYNLNSKKLPIQKKKQ